MEEPTVSAGLALGCQEGRPRMDTFLVRTAWLLPSAFIIQFPIPSLPGLLLPNMISLPSPDHAGSSQLMPGAWSVNCLRLVPSASITQTFPYLCSSPDQNAIFVPSGDHAGTLLSGYLSPYGVVSWVR